MGNEFGQTTEWNYKSELDWELLQYDSHNKLQECVRDLNHLYKNQAALYQYQFEQKGFEWIDLEHRKEAVVVYKRKGRYIQDDLLVVLNLSTQTFKDWKITVKGKNQWKEIFNSNSIKYWGTGDNQNEPLRLSITDKKKKVCEIIMDIPALSAMIFH